LRRRQGWDLVFAAPKSVSLLAMEPGGTALREAHGRAVADVVVTLEARAARVRRGGRLDHADGVVAAEFEHWANDDGQPHLHSHLVLANLGQGAPGTWSCLVGDELWRWREGLGAGYHLALRARVAEAGHRFDWELSPGGLGEIVTVPAAARAAASLRSRAVADEALRFGSASAASQRVAQGRSRRSTRVPTSPGSGPETGLRARAGLGPGSPPAGPWGPDQASAVLNASRRAPALEPPPPSAAAVSNSLAARGSLFDEPDVLVALAETSPGGLRLAGAADWARRWCTGAELSEVPAGPEPGPGRPSWARLAGGRFTTGRAVEVDRRVVDLAVEARFAHLAAPDRALAEAELAALGISGPLSRAAVSLACSGEGVAVVPAAPWLDQAACIDAARAVWHAGGVAVEVACPSELAERRWRALTSLQPAGTTPGSGPGGRRPQGQVLVVDAADHIGPVALARLLEESASQRTKLVLVVGGTVPGPGPSLARSLDQLSEHLGQRGLVELGDGNPWAEPALRQATSSTPAFSLAGVAVQGSATGWGTVAHLVAQWRSTAAAGAGELSRPFQPAAPSAPQANASDSPADALARFPIMVAFGPSEAALLNLAARSVHRSPQGLDMGAQPELVLGPRRYSVGDEVLALRRIGDVAAATRGTVVSLLPSALEVAWRDRATAPARTSLVGADQAAALGYGYATTVPYLRACRSGRDSLVVLGDPLALGDQLALAGRGTPVLGAWVTLAGPGLPAAGPRATEQRRLAALAQLAREWPDQALLALTGPRPGNPAEHRRWAAAIAMHARRRDLGLAAPAGPRSMGGPTLGR
jgi:hypothetical protein